MVIGPAGNVSTLDAAFAALIGGSHRDPFAVIGPHEDGGAIVVRAFQPAARAIDLRLAATGALVPMVKRDPAGLFEVAIERVRLKPDATTAPDAMTAPDATKANTLDYRLRITYPGDQVAEIDDPYRYGRVLT